MKVNEVINELRKRFDSLPSKEREKVVDIFLQLEDADADEVDALWEEIKGVLVQAARC